MDIVQLLLSYAGVDVNVESQVRSECCVLVHRMIHAWSCFNTYGSIMCSTYAHFSCVVGWLDAADRSVPREP